MRGNIIEIFWYALETAENKAAYEQISKFYHHIFSI